MIGGKSDFEKVNARFGILTNGSAAQNNQVGRQLPYNTELLVGGFPKIAIDTEDSGKDCLRVWVAALIGFMFFSSGPNWEL